MREVFLNAVYDIEAPPKDQSCLCGSLGRLRCEDCQNYRLLCRACFLDQHKHLHTHRILEFDNGFFRRISLASIGHVQYLGHFGDPCPTVEEEDIGIWYMLDQDPDILDGAIPPIADEQQVDMLIVDSSGICDRTFHFCKCPNASSALNQLLGAQLFPTSLTRFCTAFTFRVLDEYLLDSTECKLSLHAFWARLVRKTEHLFPFDVQV